MIESEERSTASVCRACAATDRRDFLLDALRASAALIAALGIAPSAAAMPLRLISPLAGSSTDRSYPIPTADGVQFDKDSEVILSRVGKQVYAFALACPHQNTALRWEAGDNRFQCPKHKSRYRPDGVYLEGRATRSMDRYAIRLTASAVVVDIDKVNQEDTDKAAWQQAVVNLP